MRKWQRVAIPIVLFIVYYSFMVLFGSLISNPVIAMLLTDLAIIVVCLVHNRLLKPCEAKSVPVSGWVALVITFPVFWFLTSVAATYITLLVPYDGQVMFDFGGWYICLSVLLAPVAEELLFRGVWFRHLRAAYPVWVAYGVSALMFAIIHGTWQQVYIAIFCGLFFALVYDYTGCLWVSMIVHSLYNTATLIFSGIALPDVLFQPSFILPANVILFLLLLAAIGYVTMRPSIATESDVDVQSVKDGSMLSCVRVRLQSLFQKSGMRVGDLSKQYEGDVQLVVRTHEGTCVYAGYVRDLHGNEQADVRSRKLIRGSGRALILQTDAKTVAYVEYLVE